MERAGSEEGRYRLAQKHARMFPFPGISPTSFVTKTFGMRQAVKINELIQRCRTTRERAIFVYRLLDATRGLFGLNVQDINIYNKRIDLAGLFSLI